MRFIVAGSCARFGCAVGLALLEVLAVLSPAAAQIEPLPEVTPLLAQQPPPYVNPQPEPVITPTPNSEPVYKADSPLDDPESGVTEMGYDEPWSFQLLPNTLIWHSYMAGTREPCFRSVWSEVDGTRIWDVTLGARVGIWRYGTTCDDCGRPNGWQMDIDGAVMPRLLPDTESTELVATDYRFGLTQTYGNGPFQAKFGYAHLSSHAGDEYMINNPTFQRINYVRDSLLVALGYYVTDDIRVYGEIAYAAGHEDGAEPLELQYGLEYSPVPYHGRTGAPFAAANCNLREELDFSGDFVVQAGWQWRRTVSGHRFRLGLQYYSGYSEQGEFFDQREEKFGFGMWFDF